MKLKWYGTATLLIEQDGTQLLFDPFIPINEKLFKPSLEELASASKILITHGHFDHIADVPAIIKNSGGRNTVYCTATPRKSLISKGVEEGHIHEISPGDVFDFGPFNLRVLKGKHIVFNKGLLLKTLLSPRILAYWGNFKYMLKENKSYPEAGETVVFDISITNKRLLLLGSLNLDDAIEYPKGADLLILPFQGRSDISTYAIPIIERLHPKKIFLDHFDDSFPPVSSPVDTSFFVKLMIQIFSDVPVICQKASSEWISVC